MPFCHLGNFQTIRTGLNSYVLGILENAASPYQFWAHVYESCQLPWPAAEESKREAGLNNRHAMCESAWFRHNYNSLIFSNQWAKGQVPLEKAWMALPYWIDFDAGRVLNCTHIDSWFSAGVRAWMPRAKALYCSVLQQCLSLKNSQHNIGSYVEIWLYTQPTLATRS